MSKPAQQVQSSSMNTIPRSWTRREALGGLAGGAAALWAPGVFAEQLVHTPAQTAGPFYPDKLPLDTDNDLLIVNDSITPAVGQITHLTGRVLDARGQPVRNATVEIWQVDGRGVYLHSRSSGAAQRDANFQGFGRFLTDSRGGYYFRTVKPVPYPGRTPHIHFAVKTKGREPFTTQCYIKGHEGNEADGIVRSIRDAKARQAVMVDFTHIEGSPAGELAANFEIVLGVTPAM